MRPNVNLPRVENPRGSWVGLSYAVACYVLGQGAFIYFILFLNDFWVPKGVSEGEPKPVLVTLALNAGLVSVWALQHSVMARRGFKERWTRLVPSHVERATYVLASGAALMLVMVAWTPVEGVVWDVESRVTRLFIFGVQGAAWLLLLGASFEIDHYETFGLKQPLYAMQGQAPAPIDFQVKRIYRVVRHPIQTGIFVGMWAAPTMTTSRFMFAVLMTGYILVGLYFEERDLVRQFGERYLGYRRAVPRLLPWRPPRRWRP
jgi:protein-S-isoprenylcysteine O-methyltransferase Ste14